MAEAVMFFNGIRHSFEVEESAFNWAKISRDILIAIFLPAKNEAADLGAAKQSGIATEDLAEHLADVDSHAPMPNHALATSSINLRTLLLINPDREHF